MLNACQLDRLTPFKGAAVVVSICSWPTRKVVTLDSEQNPQLNAALESSFNEFQSRIEFQFFLAITTNCRA